MKSDKQPKKQPKKQPRNVKISTAIKAGWLEGGDDSGGWTN